MDKLTLGDLTTKIRECAICANHLPHAPRPVIQASPTARILIASQAPGSRIRVSGIPFSDDSGKRLRDWMSVDPAGFYDADRVAIVPMSFCYPGKRTGGDAPPRSKCAPLLRSRLLDKMPAIQLSLLVGAYARRGAFGPGKVIDRVPNFMHYLPEYFSLPHPSWRCQAWVRRNPWFSSEALPALGTAIASALAS